MLCRIGFFRIWPISPEVSYLRMKCWLAKSFGEALHGDHQWRIIYALHGLLDAAARVFYHVFHQFAEGVIGEIGRYLVVIGLVHTVSALVLRRKRTARSVPK